MTKSNDLDPSLGDEAEPKGEPEGDQQPVTEIAHDSEDSVQAESGEQESTGQATTEFVPSDVPDRDRSNHPSDYVYRGGRDGAAASYTRQSEATYVPSEPKIYRSPDSDDDDEEESFGFPEVAENTQRLFIAIEIPRARKREFRDLAKSFRPREVDRVRWIDEEAMHLTLKFLGDTPEEMIPEIKTALQQAAESTGKFTIKIGRTGCFPSFRDPRICWVGFSGELRRLEQLQGRVEGRMVAIGLEEDDRDFRAHITVGRTRPGIRGRFAEDLGVSWQHAPLRSTGQSIPVSSIALYRSLLADNGDTEYQQLANFELI